jgi:ABC-2 type transport system permease protein
MTAIPHSTSVSLIPAIAGVTLRQLLGRRRALLLLFLSSVPILVALLTKAAGGNHVDGFASGVLNALCLTLILPIVAVLFGTAAFGAEIEDGTIVYLMAKPVARWAIVAGKVAAAAGVTAALTVGSVLIASAIAILPSGEDRALSLTEVYAAAMVVGSICYVALFVTLSLFTRRALLLGFAYVLIWEGGLSNLLPGIANLSIRQYALGVGQLFYDLHSDRARLEPGTAVPLVLILLAVTMVLSTRRLMRFEISGGSD